jgi:hypothetical protein
LPANSDMRGKVGGTGTGQQLKSRPDRWRVHSDRSVGDPSFAEIPNFAQGFKAPRDEDRPMRRRRTSPWTIRIHGLLIREPWPTVRLGVEPDVLIGLD